MKAFSKITKGFPSFDSSMQTWMDHLIQKYGEAKAGNDANSFEWGSYDDKLKNKHLGFDPKATYWSYKVS
jgi:hypothetical protein